MTLAGHRPKGKKPLHEAKEAKARERARQKEGVPPGRDRGRAGVREVLEPDGKGVRTA